MYAVIFDDRVVGPITKDEAEDLVLACGGGKIVELVLPVGLEFI